MNVTLDDECHEDEHKTQEQYHFAMSGKSFAIIEEHFPDMLQKVGSLLNEYESDSKLFVTGLEMLKLLLQFFSAP